MSTTVHRTNVHLKIEWLFFLTKVEYYYNITFKLYEDYNHGSPRKFRVLSLLGSSVIFITVCFKILHFLPSFV